MDIADDPMLALIVRFVGDITHLDESNTDFLVQQTTAVEKYVASFPSRERNARALEWIETYAKEYRQQWQRRTALQAAARTRCPDCPLTGGEPCLPCAIHDRWLQLVRRYAANGMSSSEYVKRSLQLLNEHKTELRVHHIVAHPHRTVPPPACHA